MYIYIYLCFVFFAATFIMEASCLETAVGGTTTRPPLKKNRGFFFDLVFNILTKLGWILILAFIIYALKTLCKLVGEVSSEVPIDYIVNVTDQLKNIQLKNIQS